MKTRTKYIIIGVAVLAIIGGGWAAASKGRAKPVDVKLEKVEARNLTASVTASGQVQPHTKVDVAADLSGRIMRLAVKEGDVVTRGQFLLQIDPSTYQAAVERASAAVASNRAQAAQARANLLQAKRNYERTAALKQRNPTLVADEQVEQLRTAVDVNQALLESANHGIDQALAALRDAQSSLAKTTINAPMAGRITRLNVEQGETAVPGTFNKDAATLLTISDMSTLETKVKVDETDVSRIKVGDSTVVQLDAFPDTTFVGRVVEISNSSVKAAATGGSNTDQAVDYEVRVQLLNPPPTTRPDFSATAKVITDTRKNVLSIPIIALTVRENTPVGGGDSAIKLGKTRAKQIGKPDVEGVFVVNANKTVTFHPVRVGIAGEQYFEVLSGLKRGETIVAGTYQAIRDLKDGATVRETKIDTKKPGETK